MAVRNQARRTFLRVAFSGAALFSAGLAFLPLVTEAQFGDPPPSYTWSLVANWHHDIPGGNCCVITYKAGWLYSNPPQCTKCHIQPTMYEGWEDFEAPEDYAGQPCERFDG